MYRNTLMPLPLQIVTGNLGVDRSNLSHNVAPRSVVVYAAQRASLIARMMNVGSECFETINGALDARNQ